jgi:hypothetical protein
MSHSPGGNGICKWLKIYLSLEKNKPDTVDDALNIGLRCFYDD